MKDCPDLTKMNAQAKADFWLQNDPREMRRLGDRLLAESLPSYESDATREEICQKISEAMQSLGWDLERAAEAIGTTPEVLASWEEDRVRAPESLPYILLRLAELESPPQ